MRPASPCHGRLRARRRRRSRRERSALFLLREHRAAAAARAAAAHVRLALLLAQASLPVELVVVGELLAARDRAPRGDEHAIVLVLVGLAVGPARMVDPARGVA